MNEIDVRKFYEILLEASNKMSANRDYLNSLNVFPVPDGDTGTNMSATFKSAIENINYDENANIESIGADVSKGALMGARGNSGVILSQVLRGFGRGLQGVDTINVETLSNSFKLASESAYKAVSRPKEGTILTVIKGISESCVKNIDKKDIIDFIDVVLIDTRNVLEKTRDMLPENKSAGTVDAGGAGLYLIIQSFADVLHGRTNNVEFKFNKKDIDQNFEHAHSNFEDIKFQYCTEFIIKSSVDEDILKELLERIGDSLVVVSMDGITKVHVHTNEPGTAFNLAMNYGDLTKMKVDNMKEQSENNPSNKKTQRVNQAVIAISNGNGIDDIFINYGVSRVISGGQSMNPSVEDILKCIEEANADNVIILPNNKNIILSAEQASKLSKSRVSVIKSKTIQQGLASVLTFDASLDFNENTNRMSAAINEIISCQITVAVKDINLNGIDINKGDILGIKEDEIITKGFSYKKVIIELCENIITKDTSLVTVIYGKDLEKNYIENIISELEERFDTIDVCFEYGGQELYPFLISFE